MGCCIPKEKIPLLCCTLKTVPLRKYRILAKASPLARMSGTILMARRATRFSTKTAKSKEKSSFLQQMEHSWEKENTRRAFAMENIGVMRKIKPLYTARNSTKRVTPSVLSRNLQNKARKSPNTNY